MSDKTGCRGYIASRPVRGVTFPQQVQNLVIRDYSTRAKLLFKLSATEYAMPGCYMILESVLDELKTLEGIIFFSIFMLPEDRAMRQSIFSRVFEEGGSIHAALESLVIRDWEDVERVEDLLAVDALTIGIR